MDARNVTSTRAASGFGGEHYDTEGKTHVVAAIKGWDDAAVVHTGPSKGFKEQLKALDAYKPSRRNIEESQDSIRGIVNENATRTQQRSIGERQRLDREVLSGKLRLHRKAREIGKDKYAECCIELLDGIRQMMNNRFDPAKTQDIGRTVLKEVLKKFA